MLFNSPSFAVFFIALLAVHRVCPRRHRGSFLLGCSLVFYGMWIPPYLGLLLADVVANYALLRAMQRSRAPRRWLIAIVVGNLGLLAGFKYAAFLVTSIDPIVAALIGVDLPVPAILLPLGISFFTFQILALAIDHHRGHGERVTSLREYALFVTFFPQLIAGPILRGAELLPQLRAGGATSGESDRRGVWLIAFGLAKKMVMADYLLAPFVDSVFGAPANASAPMLAVAVYSFAFQIYFDFSGYTDVARGLARLLGFELPMNFREPYLARHPAEFWRRWHITLSQWLRDYLYIPLGGNRRAPSRTATNLLLTMLLGGLWHGAAWTFVVWGGLHGLLLGLHRWLAGARRDDGDDAISWRDAPRILACFHAVCLLWIFFRAARFEDAVAILGGLSSGSWLETWPVLQCAVVVACAALHVAERILRTRAVEIRAALAGPVGGLVEGAALGAAAALIVLLGGAIGAEFIYFQF